MFGFKQPGSKALKDQVFVVVSYDFEYTSEENKKVWMKEGEVLLLINKTNHDWWQVIRRGDRRPFYAPAKYVVELRPEDVTNDSPPMSTFVPSKYNKRSSYAPPGNVNPAAMEHLFNQSRFQERYRSNSLDSILVADLRAKKLFPAAVTEHPVAASMIRKSPTKRGLEKRPTFEALDKRKSWSVDNGGSAPSSVQRSKASSNKAVQSGQSRISAYQNTQGLVPIPSSPPDPSRKKKPVPLPRSKIPVATSTQPPNVPRNVASINSSSKRDFFVRSKTDIGFEGLAAFRAKRGTKYPAPKVPPTSNRPVPQIRRPQDVKREAEMRKADKPKPEIKEKPSVKERPIAFSTFKQNKQPSSPTKLTEHRSRKYQRSASSPDPGQRASMSRAQSESDLMNVASEDQPAKRQIFFGDIPDAQTINEEEKTSLEITNQHEEIVKSMHKPESQEQLSEPPVRIVEVTTTSPSLDEEEKDEKDDSKDESKRDAVSLDESKRDAMSLDESLDDSLIISTPPPSSSSRLKSPDSAHTRSPPSPTPNMTPVRNVMVEWDEYIDRHSGRPFYQNTLTKEKSWKPPRRSKGSSEHDGSSPNNPDPFSDDASKVLDDDVIAKPEEVVNDNNADLEEVQSGEETEDPSQNINVPEGYERRRDSNSGNSFFINIFTGVRWFTATDSSGKIYFYEENGNQSCWRLPNVSQSFQDNGSDRHPSPEPIDNEPPVVLRGGGLGNSLKKRRGNNLPLSTPNFQIGQVNIVVVKQGSLHKTKLIENGKKHRKNWSSAYIVLTDTFLLFFKDAKVFNGMQSGAAHKPDQTVDLKGATVKFSSGDKSKRNNVFEVSTMLGLTVLLQDDSMQGAEEWFQSIRDVIDNLNGRVVDNPIYRQRSSTETQVDLKKSSDEASSIGGGHGSRLKVSPGNNEVKRSKSIIRKVMGGMGNSNEDLLDSASGGGERGQLGSSYGSVSSSVGRGDKMNIREKLLKFFQRGRPNISDLYRKGIMKNEPVFGSTLRELHAAEASEVPVFVKKCVAEIEKGDLLKTDGVYRQSGNLSHIQKIRLQVDQGNLGILETIDDVHVLTGALKLFFRELKEPLIPWECVDKLLRATTASVRKHKLRTVREVVSTMSPPHRSTLAFLLRHLIKVTEFQDTNRMQIPNLAIVFGPTLMWPPPHLVSYNLALDMMQQNIIVEMLLTHFQHIFGG